MDYPTQRAHYFTDISNVLIDRQTDRLGCCTCLCRRGRYDDRGGGHEAHRAVPPSSVDDKGPRLVIVGCRGQDWVAWQEEGEHRQRGLSVSYRGRGGLVWRGHHSPGTPAARP